MKITKLVQVEKGRQDGVFYNGFLFDFFASSRCVVYDATDLAKGKMEKVSEFFLDRCEEIKPHNNAVMFSNTYFEEGDEFPLLYTNMYNNCRDEADRMEGVCLVYRLQRDGNEFKTTLVQKIRVGFVTDTELWMTEKDLRPYGNFVIDTEKNILHAFVMRDKTRTTRYFSFRLPSVTDGVTDEKLNIPEVVLKKEDILDYFDCPYHQFIQGATCHKGLIYSTEGFESNKERIPAIRVIDPGKKEQILYVNLLEMGYIYEPEMIDFIGDDCHYGDGAGNIFLLEF